MPALQNFTDKITHVTSAWLNQVDGLLTTIFGQATNNSQARAALFSDNPLEVSNGGTGGRTGAAAITNLGITPVAIGAVSLAQVNQAYIGSQLYPQTPAEAAAGSVPVNPFYLPGHVDRYATNAISGTTSMTAAFQASINQQRKGGSDTVWGETAPYLIDAPLDGTNAINGLTFRQLFPQSMNPSPPGSVEEGAIIVKHNGYTVFDLAGTQMATFHDMSLVTSNTVYPKTCFFLSRATGNPGSTNGAFARILNTSIQGYFSVGILYNYASEVGIYANNNWWNEAPDAGANVAVLTVNNVYRGTANFLTSPFATIPVSPPVGAPQSCLSHEFRGGTFVMEHASSTSNLFYLEGFVSRCRLYDFWCGLSNTDGVTNGNAIVYCDPSVVSTGQSGCAGFIQIRGVHVENSVTQPLYGVQIGAAGVATAASTWAVTDSFFNVTTHDFQIDASVLLSSWRIQGMSAPSGATGFNTGGMVTDSNFDYTGLITVGGLSQRNFYRAALSNLTRGSHSRDYILDQFAGTAGFA